MDLTAEDFEFRLATLSDAPIIWSIIQLAIARRKADGSTQWQNGYPNPDIISQDIASQQAYVLTVNTNIIGYAAVIKDIEPAYDHIEGQWLTDGEYIVIHRVAVSERYLGKGLATLIFKRIEKLGLEINIHSLKVDTNFDNTPMLRILEKLDYSYCGIVYFSGAPRRAYEKVI